MGVYKLSQIEDLFSTGKYRFIYPNKDKGLSKHRFQEFHAGLIINIDKFLNLINESFMNHIKIGTYALGNINSSININS